MAHTVSKVNVGNNAFAIVKITSYTQGGESFTLAEFGITGSLVDVIFLESQDMTSIRPQYMGAGIVKLFDNVLLANGEIPTNASLNFVFVVIVQGTN